MSRSAFAVIESRWWEDGNHSVRALFEAVCAIHYDNPSAFYYDMFVDRSSLRRMLATRGEDECTEVVYLAAHGDQAEIGTGNGVTISRAEFRNALIDGNDDGQIEGLYLGTCLTGNLNTARFLLDRRTHLVWLAGYREGVDWVDGSAIDMIFFHKLAAQYRANQSRRRGKWTARDMAHEAASQLMRLVPGAHATYGFNIYFRDGDQVTAMYA